MFPCANGLVAVSALQVYHLPDGKALSDPITPLDKDGKPDAEVMARLHPRHDDSEENVMARLQLWDEHEPALRAAYEDVSLRVPGSGGMPADMLDMISDFVTLEASTPDLDIIESHKLKELQYEIINTLRCAWDWGLCHPQSMRIGI